MLIWSKTGFLLVWGMVGALIGLVYFLPLSVISMASFAGEWNGLLPTKLTLAHYAHAVSGDMARQLQVSLITGLVASGAALFAGTWAALSLRAFERITQKMLRLAFFIPSAVPSVSVGLGLLVAFSRPPILLNGTNSMVFIAHFVMVFAFTFGNVSAGLQGVATELEQVAQSLGATPAYCLRHVTLPVVLPQLATAFSLSFALSMGELGATVMIYPPGWTTMPVGIFSLSDRGEIFDGSALSIILIGVTLIALILVSLLHRSPK